MWRSWLAHYVRDVGVVRSSRIIPTEKADMGLPLLFDNKVYLLPL